MQIKLPIFLPDATRAVVKGIDSNDLISCGVKGVVVNTYHLQSSKIYDVKKFMNFNGLVVSDSGGWQIFSLIHRNKCKGKITDEGVVFYKNGAKQEIFTPEVSIQTQFKIGSDLMVCLDDFTPDNASKLEIEESVKRTVLWAKNSKKEY